MRLEATGTDKTQRFFWVSAPSDVYDGSPASHSGMGAKPELYGLGLLRVCVGVQAYRRG